jgi:hypothetical protein
MVSVGIIKIFKCNWCAPASLMTRKLPNKVHLVGTIGLDTADEVFETTGKMLGRRLRRVPDGEVGGRRLWVSWQFPLLRSSPYLTSTNGPSVFGLPPLLRVADGVSAEEIHFGELGYSREARSSYFDFLKARQRGYLPLNVRFQVGLPTPFAVLSTLCTADGVHVIEPAYTEALLREILTLTDAIPHGDLSMQWDVCNEMLIWDGSGTFWNAALAEEDKKAAILARLKGISESVPSHIPLGFHLCYGDLAGGTIERPSEPSKMIELANALVNTLTRPISYFHMPVPIGAGETFFKHFEMLHLNSGTELYLGLVQAADGEAGLHRRIELAQRYIPDFGIATGCGFARSRTVDAVRELLRLHAVGTCEPAP